MATPRRQHQYGEQEFVVLDVGHTQMLTDPNQAASLVDEIRGFLATAIPEHQAAGG